MFCLSGCRVRFTTTKGHAVTERRAPAQSDYWKSKDSPEHLPDTISWEEHDQIWQLYAAKYGKGQSAERIAERGGFGWNEIAKLTGSAPKT
jgi:hypothetical protein